MGWAPASGWLRPCDSGEKRSGTLDLGQGDADTRCAEQPGGASTRQRDPPRRCRVARPPHAGGKTEKWGRAGGGEGGASELSAPWHQGRAVNSILCSPRGRESQNKDSFISNNALKRVFFLLQMTGLNNTPRSIAYVSLS